MNNHPIDAPKALVDMGGQGRKAGGYSLRRALENQGVTTEEEMKYQLSLVAGAIKSHPNLDITRYRYKSRSN